MSGITRRDVLNGFVLGGTGLLLGPWDAAAAPAAAPGHPPSLTGLRGSHPGAFEAAHAAAMSGQPLPSTLSAPPEDHDLIVIGGGISGLAAAHFYRTQVRKNARVLILDNHDDFGGHARRNEFTVDGETRVTYGGTQSLEEPGKYSEQAAGLLRELGVDLDALSRAYDRGFFSRHGLGCGVFYDAPSFGRHVLLRSAPPTVHSPEGVVRQWVPRMVVPPAFAATLEQAPLTEAQRRQLRDVLAVPERVASYFTQGNARERFYTQTYVRFLRKVYGIQDEALLKLLSMPPSESEALGGTGVSLPVALAEGLLGLPPPQQLATWFQDRSLMQERAAEDDVSEYVHHFPDGNATVARLLVQKLVPRVARAASPLDVVNARLDYSQLDRAGHPVRVRLSSLAVRAENVGNGTRVQYLRAGGLHEARAPHTVMAGWHMMAAHILPELTAEQKAAMRANLKMPLVYAQVVLRRWDAVQRSGVGAAYCPGSVFQTVQMDFPVTFGRHRPPAGPQSPGVLLMIRMPCPPLVEASVPDLLRMGRAELLATPFATFEKQILAQLQAMYGPHGLDAARDVAAITVNRWPHGYVYSEAEYQGRPARVLASQRVGRIVMANADATGRAYTDAAVDAAWSAVQQLRLG